VQRVPFPFADLLAEIETRLGRQPGDPSPLKAVLIPLGRSLQRTAAAPEFFRYPRAVVAVDTEANHPELLLKDRLYLGYHEKAGLIEVISYNETAGRFEFQLVRDYRSGGTPRVVYANRAVCTACHQGGAPLFPRQLWDETNANPEIARLLAAEGRDFYGLPVALGVDVPAAIDAATDRANRIAVDQLLWREGCGRGESERAIRCRAAAFTAALQRRLSGGLGPDTSAESFNTDFLGTARRAWEIRWPQGLAIPDPDIPNRDPLKPQRPTAAAASLPVTLGPEEAKRLEGLVRSSHVPAFFEPLNPRPPLEVWTADGEGDQGPLRLVTGLAGFLAGEDVRRLDSALFARGSRPGAPRKHHILPCEVATQPRAGTGERVKFRCADGAGAALQGRIFLDGPQVREGTIERLDMAGSALRDLDVTAGKATSAGGRRDLDVEVTQKLTGLHARRADGNALEVVRLSWREGEGSGEAAVVFLADFAPAAEAIQDLAARTAAGKLDAFSSRPFRRTAVLGALFAELGLEHDLCCREAAGLPPPILESDGAAHLNDFPEPAIQALYRYCANCHATPEASPPNFLYGDVQTVRANLAHCAERIYFRLEVWRLPENQRPKTPMPPIHALPSLGLAADTWPGAQDLTLLRQHAAGLLRSGTGATPRLEDLEARGYENLKGCLGSPTPPLPQALQHLARVDVVDVELPGLEPAVIGRGRQGRRPGGAPRRRCRDARDRSACDKDRCRRAPAPAER
jgi:hypothetical protein